MSIEKNLERIAVALEVLANISGELEMPSDASPAVVKAVVEEVRESREHKGTGLTKDGLRETLKELQREIEPAAAKKLLNKHGAKSLTDLDVNKYEVVHKEALKLIKEVEGE